MVVVARLDRATQYAGLVGHSDDPRYWIPTFEGMTV
jgi:hypothetical protein